MSVRINTNIEALNAQRNLSMTALNFGKSVERLSSGLRINRAADDAAGLSISEKLRSQVKGLNQAIRNAQDGISMIQTGEGALNEVHTILQRMRELSVQASNDTLSTDDRKAVGDELVALKAEIDRVSTTTKFNGKALLSGALSTSLAAGSGAKIGSAAGATMIDKLDVSGAQAGTAYTITNSGAAVTLTATINGATVSQTVNAALMAANSQQTLSFSNLGIKIELVSTAGETAANIAGGLTALANVTTAAGSGSATMLIGADAGQTVSVSFSQIASTNLGSGAGSYLSDLITDNTSVDTSAKAGTLITSIDAAVTAVSTQRSNLGSVQNRLEHTIANLGVAAENLATSESRVRDLDVASEMVSFTKSQILQQAGTAILAQANQAPQSILSLLR